MKSTILLGLFSGVSLGSPTMHSKVSNVNGKVYQHKNVIHLNPLDLAKNLANKLGDLDVIAI